MHVVLGGAINYIDSQTLDDPDYSGIEVRNYDELNLACSFRSVIWMRNWAVDGDCIWDLNAVDWHAMDERKVGLMNEKVRRLDTAIDD